ncbi:6-phosphogluconolactonase [Leptospira jelokensis]|uniref:6-phosphogluconolactonase n=1 Tax=Leptospira jelokensis TaxID=2484931 RepID=A0A4Z0ZPH6_9LEPT|nr:6-phosphogluconolactonase [Leptospira jelokensis]
MHFWLADERCVPIDDTERTEKKIKEAIGEKVISKVIFHSPGFGTPIDMTNKYIQELKKNTTFNLAILGIGEDGHTASLFPGNDIGENIDSDDVFPVYNSPKMPSERISLSLNKINQSEHVIFLVSGESKKEIVRKVLCGDSLPASKVRGRNTTNIMNLKVNK